MSENASLTQLVAEVDSLGACVETAEEHGIPTQISYSEIAHFKIGYSEVLFRFTAEGATWIAS